MKSFLSYKHYNRFSTPKLNADGTVSISSDGLPIYIDEVSIIDADGVTRNYPMTKKQCLDTARVLAGPDVSLYTLTWIYDVDYSQETGYLCLLAPVEPAGKQLGNFAASDLRRQERDPNNYNSSLNETKEYEGDSDLQSKYEPADLTVDLQKSAEDSELLNALFAALGKEKQKDQDAITAIFGKELTYREAAKALGCKSHNGVKQRVDKVLRHLREELKSFQD
jgi:RNA polymerase sigma factor (sigma-70 family)